jgi:hypothetical protein
VRAKVAPVIRKKRAPREIPVEPELAAALDAQAGIYACQGGQARCDVNRPGRCFEDRFGRCP